MQCLVFLALGLAATVAAGDADVCPPRERIYTVTTGHWASYSYIDEEGYTDGFLWDLTRMVCEAVGVRCDVIYDAWTDCVTTDGSGRGVLGRGLKERMFDACLAYHPTVERIHFAKFSEPFALGLMATFYYKPGATPISDFSNKKIGFCRGWSCDAKCMGRGLKNIPGVPLNSDQIVVRETPAELKDLLLDGTIDAIFLGENDYPQELTGGVLIRAGKVNCNLGGISVIEPKNGQFSDVWNAGFAKVVLNGQFKELCKQWGPGNPSKKGAIKCVPSYNISDFRVNTPWL
jgi:hypothetical protein